MNNQVWRSLFSPSWRTSQVYCLTFPFHCCKFARDLLKGPSQTRAATLKWNRDERVKTRKTSMFCFPEKVGKRQQVVESALTRQNQTHSVQEKKYFQPERQKNFVSFLITTNGFFVQATI